MINPELQKYVATSLEGGHDATNVRHALLAAGWAEQDVDAALAAAQNPAAPATAASPAASAGPAATTMGPSNAMGDRPAATQGTSATPAGNAEPVATDTKNRLPAKKLAIAGAAVLFVLVAGGVGFAFYNGTWSLGGGMADAELLANLPANLQKIDSATYEGVLSFESVPREAGAAPFNIHEYYVPGSDDLSGQDLPEFAYSLEGISESYAYLPADISVSFTAGGSTASTDEATTDAKFHAGVEVDLADFSLSAGGELLKKGENVYFRIDKAPSLFIDLSALKDKWVAITPQDSGAALGFLDPESLQDFLNKENDDNTGALEQLRLLYGIAYEEGAVTTVGQAASEKLGEQNTRRFRLTLVGSELPDLYARASRELEEKYGDNAIVKFDQKTADYLVSQEWNKLAAYLTNSIAFDVWVDSKTGQLAKFSTSIRIVPPDEVQKLKDIQYVLGFALTLTDVNQPVTIQAPIDAMNWDDAVVLLSGKSREEVFAERQVQSVSSIRRALEDYHEYAAAYPDTLEGLHMTYAELYEKFPSDDRWLQMRAESTGSDQVLERIPVDAYTKQPYNYRRDGADYVIEYSVAMPQNVSDSYSLSQVVNGVNHATSDALSTEKGPVENSFSFSF